MLDTGDADVAFVFTTDGELAVGKYVMLDDDKKLFPPYNITFASATRRLESSGPTARRSSRTSRST